jgi:hypothetical protein
VIGVASEDLLRAIDLFEQHPARQQMRPSHRAERQHERCLLDDALVKTLGTADDKSEIGSGLAPRVEALGKIGTLELRSAPIKCGQYGAFGHGVEKKLRLARLHLAR